MKKFLLAAAAAFAALTLQAQDYSELGAKLEEYFTALAGENVEVQNRECDYLIESATDSLVRQFVTLKIYEHYVGSKIMGDEAVAVHVIDKWLSSGRVKMHSEEDLRNAKLFAEFTRASLIGKKAPQVYLRDDAGKRVSLPESGYYNVIYFYDAGCPTCKLETARLKTFLHENANLHLKAWAIYVGADEQQWAAYREDFEGVTHLWDPSMESDWQRLYGVLKTPSMFLVNPDGIIIGRGIDTSALKVLLSREFNTGDYSYGDPSQTVRYQQMFAAFGDTLNVQHIMDVADYLAARTFGEGNLDSFKQVEGDLLYFLSQQKEEVYKDAIIPFVKRYVSNEDIWDTPEDKAQVLSLGQFLSEMTARTPVGSEIPDLTVPGVLRRKPFLFIVKGAKEGTYALRKLKGKPSYIVFYSANCSACQELLEGVDKAVQSRKVKVLLVDMDTAMNQPIGQTLLDTFDLTTLPFVIQVDKKGIIQHRYVQL